MNQQRCGTLGRTDSIYLCGCVCMCGCGSVTIVQKITGFICRRGFGDSWHESAEMWCVCTCMCGCDSGVFARFVLQACINYKQFYPTSYSSKNIQLVACCMWFDVCACVHEYVCVYIECDVFVCVCVCVCMCVCIMWHKQLAKHATRLDKHAAATLALLLVSNGYLWYVMFSSSPRALAIGAKHATVTLALPLIPLDYFRRAGPAVVLWSWQIYVKK